MPASHELTLGYVGESKNASFEIIRGTSDDQTAWIGLVMSETVRWPNQRLY